MRRSIMFAMLFAVSLFIGCENKKAPVTAPAGGPVKEEPMKDADKATETPAADKATETPMEEPATK